MSLIRSLHSQQTFIHTHQTSPKKYPGERRQVPLPLSRVLLRQPHEDAVVLPRLAVQQGLLLPARLRVGAEGNGSGAKVGVGGVRVGGPVAVHADGRDEGVAGLRGAVGVVVLADVAALFMLCCER